MDRVLDFEIAGYRIKLTEGEDQLLIWPPRSVETWAHCPPRLHPKGFRVDHVSIPLKPKQHGQGAGCWRPHRKYPDGYRHYLAEIPVELVAEKLGTYSDQLGPRLLKLLRRTTPEDLDEQGYF